MKKGLIIVCVLAGALALQFCSGSKAAMSGRKKMEVKTVSYSTDVAPIIESHCTPCHFPDGGKKKFLDTYAAVSNNIDDILHRVQLPGDSTHFMPFKHKKPALTDSLIQVLQVWKDTGMKG